MRINRYSDWVMGLIVFLAGLLTILCFAPLRMFYLMPILLAILFWAIYYRPTSGFRYAYLWGLGSFITHCYWINTAIHVFGDVPKVLSIPLTMLLPLYLAIYPAVAVWLSQQFKVSLRSQLLFILPACWVVLEYLRENIILSGFGWGTLGYSQAIASPLIGYAAVGGVLLVTYTVVLLTALLCCLVLYQQHRKITLLVIVGLLLVGQGLKKINFTQADGSIAQIGLVQANIQQDAKFNHDTISVAIEKYQDLIAAYPEVDILFFPETAVPVSWESLTLAEKTKFIENSGKYKTSLALGIFKESKLSANYLNAIVGIDYLAEFEDTNNYPFYAKNHLVPFGEYRPFLTLTQHLYDWLQIPLGDLARGGDNQTIIALSNQEVAFNICYEESFGDELIKLARESSLIANETNMAWYGSSYAMDLQLQQAQVRAIELGRYVVRATNTGYSAIIDNKGVIIAALPRDVFGVLVGEVKGYRGQTPYMLMGGSFYWILCLALLLLIVLIYFNVRMDSYRSFVRK